MWVVWDSRERRRGFLAGAWGCCEVCRVWWACPVGSGVCRGERNLWGMFSAGFGGGFGAD